MLVSYRVSESERTKTRKGDAELDGSTYHAELTEFAGLVTREHRDGSCDLVIFPPNGAIRHVNGVKEGDGPGSFSRAGERHPGQHRK